jgi:hypothetical protein
MDVICVPNGSRAESVGTSYPRLKARSENTLGLVSMSCYRGPNKIPCISSLSDPQNKDAFPTLGNTIVSGV